MMKLSNILQGLACGVAGAALAACSSFELPSKKIEYQTATKLPPLEIPPDLTRPSSDDRFLVPDVTPKGTATYSAYAKDREGKPQVASGSDGVLPAQDNVRVERAGSQRWLVVKGEPGPLWPVVKDFWQENGFVVNIENPQTGVMETDWAENRARLPDIGALRGFLTKALGTAYSTAERDKFRTRLERGGESGTTEIYISHRGMEEVFVSGSGDDLQTRWQPKQADADLEAEMLRRLMVRFGVQQERVRTTLAGSTTQPERATLARGQDGSRLALNEQFDRAWRRVGLALDRVGFTVEDRDRSKGLYFVRYIDPQIDNASAKQETGWLAKLNPFSGSSKTTAKPEQYRILVRGVESGAEVNVLNKDGITEQSAVANRILTLLYDQLK
jgi:outer membrane protein assembly factor BamC